MSSELNHPQLGTVKGAYISLTVVQYRGIQYATIPERFEDALLNLDVPKNPDASIWGPSAIQPPNTCQGEHSVIQKELPIHEKVHDYSELECLNLNISVPVLPKDEKPLLLPVIVFVHGGSFILGGSSWPQYDLASFVQLSVDSGTPIIGVSFNYRLGHFGMLTSTDLQTKFIKGNHPLKDSILAFQWIQHHIQGFGGDPNNITALGESAGSCTLSALLNNETRLFDNVINMSGELPMLAPAPLSEHDLIWNQILEALDLQDKTLDEAIQLIKTMDATEFFGKTVHIPAVLNYDPQFFKAKTMTQYVDRDVLPGKHWCKKVMKGYTTADGQIFPFILHHRAQGLGKSFPKYLSTISEGGHPEIAQSIQAAVSINADGSTDDSEALALLCPYLGHLMFQTPAFLSAENWPESIPVYFYKFNLANPWDGPSKGLANHIFDIVVLLQTYKDYLPVSTVQAGQEFAKKVFLFMSKDQEPWTRFQKDDPRSIYEVTAPESAAIVNKNYDRELLSAEKWDLYHEMLSPYVYR